MLNQTLLTLLTTLITATENYRTKWSKVSTEETMFKNDQDTYECNLIMHSLPFRVVLKREYSITENDIITISIQQTNIDRAPKATVEIEVCAPELRDETTLKAIELERVIFNKFFRCFYA